MPEPVVVRASLRLVGSGIALPACPTPEGPRAVIPNDHVVAIVGANARSDRERQAIARLVAANGCQDRHWSHWIGAPAHPDEESTDSLAERAAREALENAKVDVRDIDFLILALSTSTFPTIATSTPLCERLGYRGPSMDLKAGCAGSLYALQLAATMLSAGYRRILVVGADTMSKYVDATALKGFVTVGDGAGAVVLERAEATNFVCMLDGEYASWDTAGVFGTLPPQADALAAFTFRGAPTQLREAIGRRYREALAQLLAHERMSLADLEAWVPHQISLPLLQEVYESFGTPSLRFFHNFGKYGNTGSASLLIALHEARSELGSGWVALSALGGGMRWGAALWKEMA